MKNRTTSRLSLFAAAAALSLLPSSLTFAADTAIASGDAQATTPAVTAGVQPATPAATANSTTATAQTKLPYGVEDVVKLSRAQVSEDVILNFVQSSGTIYNLGPKDLVALKEAGVSD